MGDVKYLLWNKITVEELKSFPWLLRVDGNQQLTSTKGLLEAWSSIPLRTDCRQDNQGSFFLEISRYLHFVDNDTLPRDSPSYDRLGKVRPLIDHFSQKFKSVYLPHKEVAIDEAMIKFTGRSSLKQYMPMKPIKHGIKVWVLGYSSNGYFLLKISGGWGSPTQRHLSGRPRSWLRKLCWIDCWLLSAPFLRFGVSVVLL